MSVRVLFFASLRESTGCEALTLPLQADDVGIDELLQLLSSQLDVSALPALTAESVRVAVNQELMTGPFRINDGDEVAFLPPVTGG